MMCLRSGLKVETTWALETLTVVLFDDVTVHHINIDSLPGIVDILLQHLKLHLDKLTARRQFESSNENTEIAEENKSSTANGKVDDMEEKRDKNGYVAANSKSLNERKRRHSDESVEVTDSMAGEKDESTLESKAKRLSENAAESEVEQQKDASLSVSMVTNLETLRRLKAMSLTKEDRDASSYNCLHGEVLQALKRQRLSCNGRRNLEFESQKKTIQCSDHEMTNESSESYRCEQLLETATEEFQDRARRVLSITNILRSFSCLPANEDKLSRHNDLLKLCSQLIQFAHWHPKKAPKRQRSWSVDEVVTKYLPDDWEATYLYGMRENCIVLLSNIAAKINLDNFDESCVLSLMDSLIHWLVCKSCSSIDPVPGAIHSTITMQRLALETLCKMCLAHHNTDYLLATPPSARIRDLVSVLLEMVVDNSKAAIRELALVLLTYLAKSDIGVAQICSVPHFGSKLFVYLQDSMVHVANCTNYPSSRSSSSPSTSHYSYRMDPSNSPTCS